jgi:hypothetical protein
MTCQDAIQLTKRFDLEKLLGVKIETPYFEYRKVAVPSPLGLLEVIGSERVTFPPAERVWHIADLASSDAEERALDHIDLCIGGARRFLTDKGISSIYCAMLSCGQVGDMGAVRYAIHLMLYKNP